MDILVIILFCQRDRQAAKKTSGVLRSPYYRLYLISYKKAFDSVPCLFLTVIYYTSDTHLVFPNDSDPLSIFRTKRSTQKTSAYGEENFRETLSDHFGFVLL